MKVIDPCCTLLTNSEVFSILSDVKSKQGSDVFHAQKSFQNHNTVVYESLKYLSGTKPYLQSRLTSAKCIQALSKFKLTAAELKQIVNLRPEQPIDIQLIVEECEERLTEEQVDEVIAVVAENISLSKGLKRTIINGMHVLATIEDVIRIPFHRLGEDFTATIIEKINKQYSNYVIEDVGLCVSFYDFIKIGDAFLLPGESFTCTPVTFRYIVYQPLVNEIFTGNILRSNRDGIVISMEFCSDIVVEPDKLPSVSKFDETEQTWYWEYKAEDGEEQQTNNLYMEPGQRVRCRVLSVHYTNVEPGINSDLASAITIKASMADTGLGCLAWWENAEQVEEDAAEDIVEVT